MYTQTRIQVAIVYSVSAQQSVHPVPSSHAAPVSIRTELIKKQKEKIERDKCKNASMIARRTSVGLFVSLHRVRVFR